MSLALQVGVAAIILRVLCRQRPRLSKGVGLPELRKVVVGGDMNSGLHDSRPMIFPCNHEDG